MKVITIFGTRPEAIKMAPLVLALRSDERFDAKVCVTGQHGDLVHDANALFGIEPGYDLKIMREGQGLTHITTSVLRGLEPILEAEKPDYILVHGDTTTSMAAALAGFYAGVKIGHVEAGLRSNTLQSPWPEEANRQLTARLANLHFAPTQGARQNLLGEGIAADRIFVTGNTVIDALQIVVRQFGRDSGSSVLFTGDFSFLDDSKRLILVTGHRRENHDGGLARICHALKAIAQRSDVQIVYPVHPNPAVSNVVHAILGDVANIILVDPLSYPSLVWLMKRSALIVTDSGGIQEEAPSLGKPVLVTREVTERAESIEAGTARLVGTDGKLLEAEVHRLLDDPAAYNRMVRAHHPYGDGNAAARIVEILASRG